MAHEKLFHVGIKALIINKKNEVLVLDVNTETFKLHKTPHGDMPGGRIQQGQDLVTTLKREIKEEIGISQVNNIRFLTAVISNIEIPLVGNQTVGLVLMVYEVSIPEDSTITLSDEHTGYSWVSRAEAKKRLAYKYTPEFLARL